MAFCLVGSKFCFPGSLQPLAAQINIDRSHPQIHQINHMVYQFFFDVTAVNGEYQNAESTKHVTVTGPYRIDRNCTVPFKSSFWGFVFKFILKKRSYPIVLFTYRIATMIMIKLRETEVLQTRT